MNLSSFKKKKKTLELKIEVNIEIYSLLNNKQIKDAECEATERKEERRNAGGGGPEINITCAPILFRLNAQYYSD